MEKPWLTSSHCGKFVNLVEAFLFSIWLSRRWAAHMSFGLGLVFVFRIFLAALFCLHLLRTTQIGRLLSLKFAACGAAVSVCLCSVCRRDILIIHFDFFSCQTACCQKGIEEGVGWASRGCLPIRLGLEEESNRACSRPACDL